MIDDNTAKAIAGQFKDGQVCADPEELAAYAYDAWPVSVKRQQERDLCHLPDLVIHANDVDDVVRALELANVRCLSLTPRGAGSSVVGGPLPLDGGLVLDMQNLNRIIELDERNMTVRVEAGMLGGELERLLGEHGYTTHFSPQSLLRSTVGGWVATRATGQMSARWGGIEDSVVSLTVVLPTGRVLRTTAVPRASVGPDLANLFTGSEGTLGVIVDVTLRIHPLPAERRLEAITFTSVAAGLDAMRRVMQAGLRPSLLRFYDYSETRHAMRDQNFDGCVMFVGCEGPVGVAEAEMAAATDLMGVVPGQRLGAQPVEGWLERRYDFSAIEGILDEPGGVAETIEVANTWSGIEETYSVMRHALGELVPEVLGHFSHAYTHGTSLYLIVTGQAEDAAAARATLEEIWRVSMGAALNTGAVLSHHHGVGIARLPYLGDALGEGLDVLRTIKRGLDPLAVLSPGKLNLSDGSTAVEAASS